MDAEHIILSKRYMELSADELAEISSYASNESEFDDMKAFLVSTHSVVNNQKIKTSSELDKKVLNYLNHSYPQVQPWYNSVLLFLFPRDKQFYKYPAFQLVVATILVFGVFNSVDLTSANKTDLAFEDLSKYKTDDPSNFTTVQKEEVHIEQEIDLKLKELISIEEEKEEEASNEKSIEDSYTEEIEHVIGVADINRSVFDEVNEVSEASMPSSELEMEKENMIIEKDLEDEEDETFSDKVSTQDAQPIITSSNKNVKFNSNEQSRKKDKKALKPKLESSATLQKETSFKELRNKVSLQSTPEILELFFEVK